MPQYEYECEICGARVTKLNVSVAKRDDLDTVPQCEHEADGRFFDIPMKRVLFGAAPVFKGDGWARDNYGIKPSNRKND